MTTISKIVIVLFLSLTIVAFDYIIDKIRTNKNKGKVESKEELEFMMITQKHMPVRLE